ncbi:M20 family metallopeptidase [Nonomuraea endophytica]|uniref:Glutamate carboxypeptidase n=1 Tax=Nonomuraea endophytica TaxID=714136 RepID=A0A7W8A696_9ACTN|nr:M20 family metallopeptidase [Nonomuraea endophytica]MBB5079446.1 glutamate carboxypeptidase [Nonomuraea endophytica]
MDHALLSERLSALVGVESPSGHAEGLEGCYALMRSWGEPVLGRTAEVVTVRGTPHLLWRAPAEGGVLLLGHADTVWPLGTTAHRPFRAEGGRAYGPGVFDMKAGLVTAFAALAGCRDPGSVSVLITGDEEIGSPTSRALVEEMAGARDAVLVLEPSQAGALKTARKGGAFYSVEITGRAAHAGLEPERGVNALLELAAQVVAVSELADPARGTTVTPTVASAGTATNTVPAQAHLRVDVRAWELAELARVDERLRELAPTVPGAAVRVHGEINRPPLEPVSSRELYAAARKAAAHLGLPDPDEVAVGGASDANFTGALGIPTLDGLGPLGDGAHAEHEWVELASLADRARLVAALIGTLTRP